MRTPAASARVPATPLAALALLAAVGCSEPGPPPPPSAPAELTALIVVDQFRPDMLTRYEPLWTGGFRRLLDEGFVFTAATHAHTVTETAVGHATLATGLPPSRHGIAANSWYEADGEGGFRSVYAVEDPGSPLLGVERAPGRSPVNLRAPTLAEWIAVARPGATVVSISKKDRSAITMAGGVPGSHVYWIHYPEGRFVTSEWYRGAYPPWIERANETFMPGVFADTVWESGVPPEARSLSRPDTFPAEGDATHTAFPHRAALEAGDGARRRNRWIAESTPATDWAVLGLALRALDEVQPDVLALSFSAVDYVGHQYGPFSREQLDNLLRLDRTLGTLFEALDEKVGPGRWVLALSADHGVAEVPEAAALQGRAGRRLTREERRTLEAAMAEAYEEARAADPGVEDAGPLAAAAVAEGFDFVAEAYTRAELRALAGGVAIDMDDGVVEWYRNAWVPDRIPGGFPELGVEVRFGPGVLAGRPGTGTTHGTPYDYDRDVPLIFLGRGVSAGTSDEPVYTYDVAPTLAWLSGLAPPDWIEGRVLRVGW